MCFFQVSLESWVGGIDATFGEDAALFLPRFSSAGSILRFLRGQVETAVDERSVSGAGGKYSVIVICSDEEVWP